MMHMNFENSIGKSAANVPVLTGSSILMVLLQSMILGILLVLVTYMATKVLREERKAADAQHEILGVANLMFVTVGLAGVMLLVNNNIVRAFSIFAAIALIRFRVKLDSKSINASYLFSVLAGMACGLQEFVLAWAITGVYVLLLVILSFCFNAIRRASAARDDGFVQALKKV